MDCSRLLEGSCREESEENLKGADQNAEVQTWYLCLLGTAYGYSFLLCVTP